jgi:TonB family protein
MPALMSLRLAHPIAISTAILADVSISGTLRPDRSHWLSTLVALYVLVAGVLSLRLATSFIHMWRILRGASRLDADWIGATDVRIAAQLAAPVTFGSTILLPADYDGWSPEKRAAVLAHEREHVRAGDCLVQWLASAHVCLFWFSPLSWWLRGHLGTLAEHSSDDAALREVADRADYAAVLLEAAQSRAAGRVAIPIASKRSLAGRINRILSGRMPYEVPSAWRRALAIVLVLPAALLAAATSAQEPSGGAAPGPLASDGSVAHIVATDGGSERWYPAEAKRKGTEGIARIAVTLDTTGLATDEQVVSEAPEGSGFGAAAIEMARTFTYANPTGHPTTLLFNVKFELQGHSGGHYGTTNFESGSAGQPPPTENGSSASPGAPPR